MYNVIVVGCGITGAVLARRLALQNKKVLIIDKREHIAGNCYDYSVDGVTVHRYGPHIFHTNSDIVWSYLSEFTGWHYYMHKVVADVDGMHVPLPFNLNSVYKVFPPLLARKLETRLLENYAYGSKVPIITLMASTDNDLKFLAKYIYEKVYINYTLKQWGVKPEEIDKAVSARVPVHVSKDDRYFTDKYQAIPDKGYTQLVKNILAHPLIDVKTGISFDEIENPGKFEKIYYTGAIDGYYSYRYGKLPYRSIRFDIQKYEQEYYQSNSVINYPNNYDFTRITEFKYFLNEKSDITYISKEYPGDYAEGVNEPFYPVTADSSLELYNKYLNESKSENIVFAGRLGAYRYFDMDEAIYEALSMEL